MSFCGGQHGAGRPTRLKQREMCFIAGFHAAFECSSDSGGTSITSEVDNIDFHTDISAKLIYWSVLNASAQTNSQTSIIQRSQERPDWLLRPTHVCPRETHLPTPHTHTHSWGPAGFILKVKSCWEAAAPHWWAWWSWHHAAHCTHMLICPQTWPDSST